MSGVFFLSLPDLKSLCCVALTLHDDYEEPRTKQMTTCRELVLLFSDVLAAPALDSFTEITAVMSIQFFESGVLQGFIQRHSLQMNRPEQVYPGILQSCLSFSLVSRLSPNWNKVGLYLVSGRDFLSERGRVTAVSLELSTSDGALCMSLTPNTVRLNPTNLQDLGLSPLVLTRFCSDPDSVLDPHHTGGPVWCHVLPSMKKGQIITISRKLPRDGPFKSYRELQSHWNRLYGYRLPDQDEDQVVYCNVYFKLVGQNLFTYPLCCVRLAPVQRCPRVDLQGALSCFMDDVRETLPSVCGFTTKVSTKSSFTTTAFNPASQISGPLNLSASSSSRPVLTQTAPRPTKPFSGWQPAPAPLLSSSSGSFSSPPSSSKSTPDFSDLFKPASNPFFTIFDSKSSPPSPPLLIPEEKTKFVPIFRRKPPSALVNVAALKEKKQNAERLTLPTTSARAPTFLPEVSSWKTSSNVKRIPTFSPKRGTRPAPVVARAANGEKEKKKSKTVVKFNLEETAPKSTASDKKTHSVLKNKSALKVINEEKTNKSIKGEENPRASKELDVEQMFRNNQLSRVSSVKMLQWLRARGLNVQHKVPKERLMLKVMGCLAES